MCYKFVRMVRFELTLLLKKNKTPDRVTSVKSPEHKVRDFLSEYFDWKLFSDLSYLTSAYSTSTFANSKTKTNVKGYRIDQFYLN